MSIVEPGIRPLAEADSCSICGVFFLWMGDALVLANSKLVPILEELESLFFG